MKDFSAYWHIFPENLSEMTKEDKEKQPVINNISLEIKKGQHIALVGKVGCGKSSFLNCFLREIPAYK